ncbi:MAG: hypothetical protein K2R98_27705 [Gemmataceae bacterium]|nr:hypothetical protein [Gemmataceae bacterium]
MKSACFRLAVLGLSAVIATANPVSALGAEKAKEFAGFGVLRAPSAETVKAQAQEWFKNAGKTDEASQQAFNAIWADADRPLLDKVTDTFVLGSPDAAKLMAEARNVAAPAPKEVPTTLRDMKANTFYRANLALAYAKALSNRRVYEEALDSLKTVKAEQVVDPATFFFHKAVCEHGLIKKDEATKTITRLLDDVADAPERYKMVAALMFFDMQGWKEKLDLGHIGRLMGNVERRLDLARGGAETQKIEREVIHRLDELIKQLEKQGGGGAGAGSGPPNGGACPGGAGGSQPGNSPGNTNQPSAPQQDSMGGTNGGPGNVDLKELKNKIESWGKLPEKERAAAMQDLIKSLPAANQKQIEEYYKAITRNEPK